MENAAIVGTLPIKHFVDPNGSLSIDVPIQLPPARLTPHLSFAYHSASGDTGVAGIGWVVKGIALIERAPATLAQDGFRGSINYDNDDRFILNGQRLVNIAANEYRYEIDQWSKITSVGSDPANPDSWVENLPDGTTRFFGNTIDSNVKAQDQSMTRVWAVSEYSDPFSNYVSYSYTNDASNGSFYISEISYGGNRSLDIAHQRQIAFMYEDRPDPWTQYIGGFKIYTDKRLLSISASVGGQLIHTHSLGYDVAPLTARSRLRTLTLSDSSGVPINPLCFDWNDGDPAVFNSLQNLGTVTDGTTSAQILPIDVSATGRSDVVLTSTQYDSDTKSYDFHVTVYPTDAKGTIATSPASGAGFTGLPSPTYILTMDVNGNGCIDLLHIKSTGSGTQRKHTLTVLLSTPDGYKAQTASDFQPESFSGQYFAGDFEGNGNVGLIYIYDSLVDGKAQLRFVQLVSDGCQFSALDAVDGPSGVALDKLRVVVGDLNGNGAQDVFLISPTEDGSSTVCQIGLIESQKGILCFRTDEPLSGIGEDVPWTSSTTFFPHSVDGDGKTGLLAISKSSKSYLQFQILRSTGPSLVCQPSPTTTSILYSGQISLARTSSTESTDLVNTFGTTSSGTTVSILRFSNDTFVLLDGVQQGGDVPHGSSAMLADLRGTGRTDCLFSKFDSKGNITLYALVCSGSSTVDFLNSYRNGLGATISVVYCPLSDPQTYTDTGNGSGSMPAALNAMSRNIASSASLSSSGAVGVPGTTSRSVLVHFPKFVVKQLTSCASPSSQPEVFSQTDYTYQNARRAFDGRGWLGFETIVKTLRPLGVVESSTYIQAFPFLGQLSRTQRTADDHVLESKTYNWTSVPANNGVNQYLILPSLRESYFEAGIHVYDANISHEYDSFANVTKLTISVQPEKPALPVDTSSFDNRGSGGRWIIGNRTLTVDTTFVNDTDSDGPWIIGNKISEAVKSGDGLLKKTEFRYVAGTKAISQKSKWIAGTDWSTQTIEFDKAGNETTVKGPGPSLKIFGYDETHSFPISVSTFTNLSFQLTHTTTFDFGLGRPLSVTDPIGHIISHSYDVLGRILEVSEGDDPSRMVVMEKRSIVSNGDDVVHLHQTRCDWAGDSWARTVAHVNGFGKVWRTETPKPDDPSSMIYRDIEYDGAGRIVKRSEGYLRGQAPRFTVHDYDFHSRPVTVTSPAAVAGLPPITTTYQYKPRSTNTVVVETRSGGGRSSREVVMHEIEYKPNPKPAAKHYIKAFSVSSVNALGQIIQTAYDGLGRPVLVKDPNGVRLSFAWDGLSRKVERRISNPEGVSPAVVSHLSSQRDDVLCQTTVRNELTGLVAITKYDFIHRPISKITSDETLTYVYDEGGTNAKNHLVSVISSKGIEHHFDYDARGSVIASKLSIDDHIFLTRHEWTPSKKLRRSLNPDGSTVTTTYFTDSNVAHIVDLANPDGIPRVSLVFSNFDGPSSRPLSCELGNGLQSTVSLAENGTPISMVLSRGQASVYQQIWELDGFGRIGSYINKPEDSFRALNNSFDYDAGGQIVHSYGTGADGSSLSPSPSETFSYDNSGNLVVKDDKTIDHNGWQLSRMRNQDGSIYCSFQYTADGNLTAKLDSSGKLISAMEYDADGRLSKVDGTSFVYDFKGRLIKSVRSNGLVTWYPSHSYEVSTALNGITRTAYITQGDRRLASLTEVGPRASAGPDHRPLPRPLPASSVHYFHHDHLGSVVASSSEFGEIRATYAYDPFGKVVVEGDDISRYKYSGKEQFGGLYYFGARFYDPETGRFLTLDNYPVSLTKISPSMFNQYAFARNDPINFVDVNGNVPWWHWAVDAGLIVGGGAVLLASEGSLEPIAGALIGAGIGGLQQDAFSEHGDESSGSWLVQLGIGGAFGAVGGYSEIMVEGLAGAAEEQAMKLAANNPAVQNLAGVVAKASIKYGVPYLVLPALRGLEGQIRMNIVTGSPIFHEVGLGALKGIMAGTFEDGYKAGLREIRPAVHDYGNFISNIIEEHNPTTSIVGQMQNIGGEMTSLLSSGLGFF